VGARTAFLEENKNGFLFKSGDVTDLKNTLVSIVKKSDSELIEMANLSVEKAKQITPEKWCETLLKVK
jgi:hypothetical protein